MTLSEQIDTDATDPPSEGSEPDTAGSDESSEQPGTLPDSEETSSEEALAMEEADQPALTVEDESAEGEPGAAGEPSETEIDEREAKGEVSVLGAEGTAEQEAAVIEEAIEQQAAEVGEETIPAAEEEAVHEVPGVHLTAPEAPAEQEEVLPAIDESQPAVGPAIEAEPVAEEAVEEAVEEEKEEPEEEPEEPAVAEPEEPTVAEPEEPTPVQAEEPSVTVGDPFAGPGEWYVIHTYAGYENKVKANLGSRIHTMQMQDKIFDVVIPMEDVMEIKGGRKQIVQKKVFPGYLLVRMVYDDDSWYVVRNTPGVTGFVSSGTGQKPTPLPRAQVEKFLAPREEEAKPAYRLEFAEQDVVRIISGPFADFTGTITEINVDQSKVKVLVNIFDRETPVELGFDQVARV